MSPILNSRKKQQGLALLVMVVIVMLGSMFILTRQLNSVALHLESGAVTTSSLSQAKEGLIGYAAINVNRPGGLPCPDLHAPGDALEGTPGDAAIGTTCTTSARRVGRLPWKTLGLPDLRDASGERLWYALSDNLRDNTGVVINSESLGTLTVTGTAPESGVVAIVFAPGAALGSQSRDPADSSTLTTVTNYLDGANGDVANDDTFVTGLASDAFNDTLVTITHSDLFSVVENQVAKRLETDVKPFINSYVAQWSAYPFAVPFNSAPSTVQNNYKGTVNTTYGWLPVTLDATSSFLKWRVPGSTEQLVTVTGRGAGTGTGTLTSNCSATTATVFSCSITYTKTGGGTGTGTGFQPKISVTPTLANVGMALVDYSQVRVSSSNVVITSSTGVTKPAWNSNSLRTDGGADMLFTNGTLRATGTSVGNSRTVTLTITWSSNTADYLYVAGQASDWFFTNQWYRMTYYAMSSGYAPGQTESCVAGGSPLCITVNNLTGTTNNKGAVLVLAGRAGKKSDGSSQSRPSATLSDYFEGENLTPADRTFETGTRSPSFNDKVVVLTP